MSWSGGGARGVSATALGLTPSIGGFLAWTGDPVSSAGSSAGVLTSGQIYTARIPLVSTISVTNIVMRVQAAGVTLTAAQSLCSLYTSTGTLLGSTADQSSLWTSTGVKTMALASGPFSVGAPCCYIEILSVGTTPPAFSGSATNGLLINANLSGATFRWGLNGTGKTATDPSLTPSGITSSGNVAASWVGLT